MTLKQMEYFTAIVHEGSISGAARSLHISQPPLSTQIRLLEEELQTTLFERGSRSIVLTDAGRLFYIRIQSILDMTRSLEKDLTRMGQGLLGTLRLGMISSVETAGIITTISLFHQLYPQISFRIYEGNTYKLLDRLSRGQIELALVRTPFPEEGLEYRTLKTESVVAVGIPRLFPDPKAREITLEELASCPLITYRRWELVLNRLFPQPLPEYLCINDDARTSLTWAAAGAGIAIVPSSIIRDSSDDLMAKPIHHPDLASTIALVKQKNAILSLIGQHFYQFLKLPLEESDR